MPDSVSRRPPVGPVSVPAGPRPDSGLGVLARALVEAGGIAPTVEGAVAYAVTAVPCDWAVAAVTHGSALPRPRFYTASDASVMELVTEIATAATSSPGRLALARARTVHIPDLGRERRFGSYPAQMLSRTPIRSVVATPLMIHGEVLGVMTLYSREIRAFDGSARARAALLADFTAIAVESVLVEERAANLEVALGSARVIGAAIGVLVERHKITPEEAFDRLRVASQQTNTKVATIAEGLVRTGELTAPPALPA